METATNRTVRAEPSVTPMIDVMLVLLIMFLVSIPMIIRELHASERMAIRWQCRQQPMSFAGAKDTDASTAQFIPDARP